MPVPLSAAIETLAHQVCDCCCCGCTCGIHQVAMAWSMSQKERDETVERLTANICSMSFFRGSTISDDTARAAAIAAERKAYTAAQVAARTTTGDRPASESISTYARSAQTAGSWQHSSAAHVLMLCMVLGFQETERAGPGSSSHCPSYQQ